MRRHEERPGDENPINTQSKNRAYPQAHQLRVARSRHKAAEHGDSPSSPVDIQNSKQKRELNIRIQELDLSIQEPDKGSEDNGVEHGVEHGAELDKPGHPAKFTRLDVFAVEVCFGDGEARIHGYYTNCL